MHVNKKRELTMEKTNQEKEAEVKFDRIKCKPTRRAFLRGAGVALTLPWLESIGGLSQMAAAAGPRRAS